MEQNIISTNYKIAKATAVLIVISIVAHILSIFKEILTASNFGITEHMDAFYAASAIPVALNNIVVTSFLSVFIPIFIKNKLKNMTLACLHISKIINAILLVVFLVSLLLMFFASALIGIMFKDISPGAAETAIIILRLLSMNLLLSVAGAIASNILNTFEQFFWPSIAQSFVTVFTIILLLCKTNSMGIFTIVYGWLAGTAVQLIVLAVILLKRGYRHHATIKLTGEMIDEFLQPGMIFMAAMILSQLNIVIDRVMSASLPPGNISVLGYAEKMIQIPMLVFSGSIITAMFPYISLRAAENKIGEIKDYVYQSIIICQIIFLPLTAMILVFSEPFIAMLFQRGEFTQVATHLTTLAFKVYSAQLIFYTVYVLIMRILLTIRDTLTILYSTILGLCIKIILNIILIRIVYPPLIGLALSTTISMVVLMFYMLYRLKTNNILLPYKNIVQVSLKVICGCTAGTFIMYYLSKAMHYYFFTEAYRAPFIICSMLTSAIAGIIVFVKILNYWKISEMSKIQLFVKDIFIKYGYVL